MEEKKSENLLDDLLKGDRKRVPELIKSISMPQIIEISDTDSNHSVNSHHSIHSSCDHCRTKLNLRKPSHSCNSLSDLDVPSFNSVHSSSASESGELHSPVPNERSQRGMNLTVPTTDLDKRKIKRGARDARKLISLNSLKRAHSSVDQISANSELKDEEKEGRNFAQTLGIVDPFEPIGKRKRRKDLLIQRSFEENNAALGKRKLIRKINVQKNSRRRNIGRGRGRIEIVNEGKSSTENSEWENNSDIKFRSEDCGRYKKSKDLIVEIKVDDPKQIHCRTLAHDVYERRKQYGEMQANCLVSGNVRYIPFLQTEDTLKDSNNAHIDQPPSSFQEALQYPLNGFPQTETESDGPPTTEQHQNNHAQNHSLFQNHLLNIMNSSSTHDHQNAKMEIMEKGDLCSLDESEQEQLLLIQKEEERFQFVEANLQTEIQKIHDLIQDRHQQLHQIQNQIHHILNYNQFP
jgi:hypothetical protein